MGCAAMLVSATGLVEAQVVGDRVDISGSRGAPRTISTAPQRVAEPSAAPSEVDIPGQRPVADGATPPFGANLFTGGFRAEREDGLNPEYVVRPGDHVAVRLWGATTFDGELVVDAQGNVFLPDIGPIRVGGRPNAQLTDLISAAVRRVFTDNVRVYTNLLGTQPVVVFVTGYVLRPGSYAGVASDSLLYFLSRAGGVDPDRGSYRRVLVKRGKRVVAEADLYRFLLRGELPRVQFRDGDTVVVESRGSTVEVTGQARNAYLFEMRDASLEGGDLLELARPSPDATHATVVGTRDGKPYADYLTLSELAPTRLLDGDQVTFESDRHEETILVRIEGSHLGPSRFAVPRDTRLLSLLDHVEVNPAVADVESVSLRRASIAARQKQALDDSLRRLELAVLSASSQTDEEARIRGRDAELIASFVERARGLEPEGVLVVAGERGVEDVHLQPGDVVTIPERSNVVLVGGEVMIPQAVLYDPDRPLGGYISGAGGLTDRADTDRFILVRRNGEVLPGDFGAESTQRIRPGDEIIILPKVPVKNLQLVSTISQIVFQAALATATVLGLD